MSKSYKSDKREIDMIYPDRIEYVERASDFLEAAMEDDFDLILLLSEVLQCAFVWKASKYGVDYWADAKCRLLVEAGVLEDQENFRLSS